MTVAYLACPYNHPDPFVKKRRYQIATRAAFALYRQGQIVYSPITHNIPIAEYGIETGDWGLWQQFDLPMLAKCDRLIVLRLPGWEISTGVTAEIAHAKSLGLPIEWMDPTEEWLDLLREKGSLSEKP